MHAIARYFNKPSDDANDIAAPDNSRDGQPYHLSKAIQTDVNNVRVNGRRILKESPIVKSTLLPCRDCNVIDKANISRHGNVPTCPGSTEYLDSHAQASRRIGHAASRPFAISKQAPRKWVKIKEMGDNWIISGRQNRLRIIV
jgi:hypothetical protein